MRGSNHKPVKKHSIFEGFTGHEEDFPLLFSASKSPLKRNISIDALILRLLHITLKMCTYHYSHMHYIHHCQTAYTLYALFLWCELAASLAKNVEQNVKV